MLRGLALPGTLSRVLDPFRPCFTAPSFETFTVLVAGLVAQPVARTVCGMLTGAGLARVWHHARAHRFFSAARWCPPGGGAGAGRDGGDWSVASGGAGHGRG
jgi:hypothetical protein